MTPATRVSAKPASKARRSFLALNPAPHQMKEQALS
jgi:hypothetical protein